MKLKPLPPIAYTATMSIVYLAAGVGSALNAMGWPTVIPGLLVVAFASLAVCEALRGVAVGECFAAAAIVPCLCCIFALSPPTSGSWALWSYAWLGCSVAVISVRCSWLSRQ